MKIEYTIHGAPRTKKNSQQILGFGKPCPVCKKRAKQFIAPSAAYKKYEKAAIEQLTPSSVGRVTPTRHDACGTPIKEMPAFPLSAPLNMRCLYYMPSRRKVDLCNLLEATCDIFVEAGILEDDNSSIVVSHDGSRVLYDKDKPRVEISLEVL